ncbi:hypothetical protein OY671_000776 [Metschnikowia pulcherrima]|nr:hypothetical protein OY671_000776 [Metschnikowia pulcherrima]
MVPMQARSSLVREEELSFPYTANLAQSLPSNTKESAFSLGQLSMVFLVDLFRSKNDMIVSNLPLLLHKANQILETLRKRDYSSSLWTYDDLNNDKKGGITPKNMDLMVRVILELFTPAVPTLQEEWIFPIVDLSREEFAGMGADLIAPLLRLLLTEYAEAALEVIDEVPAISGSQLDKDILRMSMGNDSMRKEYEQVASLFGIPNVSGWAIPMPAMTAARTRHNVHAVFATCIDPSTVLDERRKESTADEDIQFLMEDYYAPPPDQIDSVSVTGEEPAASLSNMWAALDDFDSFFTKPSDQKAQMLNMGLMRNAHGHSLSSDTKQSGSSDLISPVESVPQVYDKRALGILNRSLARSRSNTSFKSSLADNFGSPIEATHPEVISAKKSYIPFRNSRLGKGKSDQFATPTMNGGSTFEGGGYSTPSRASMRSTPSSNAQMRMPSPQEIRVSPEPTEAAIRFDHILGGGRKRKTKS